MKLSTKAVLGIAVPFTCGGALSVLAARRLFHTMLKRSNVLKTIDNAVTPNEWMNERQVKNFHKEMKLYKEWEKEHPYQKIYITSHDQLRLAANLYPQKVKSHKWAILVHGFRGQKEDLACSARRFFMLGYNILAVDNRGHGESGGDYITMGWEERIDLRDWISYLLDKDPDAEIILYGISMGASSVLMASGCGLPKQVRAVIADCGYTSAHDMFLHAAKKLFHLSEFPVISILEMMVKAKAGYDVKDVNVLEYIKKSKTPIYIIHGECDDYVPTEMGHALYNACRVYKKITIIKNAKHAFSCLMDPDTYFGDIEMFVNSCRKLQ